MKVLPNQLQRISRGHDSSKLPTNDFYYFYFIRAAFASQNGPFVAFLSANMLTACCNRIVCNLLRNSESSVESLAWTGSIPKPARVACLRLTVSEAGRSEDLN
jgi:hypothetical protein